MPVRSLTSSVLRWPSRQVVDEAVREWAAENAGRREDVVAVGYFGSYARGDWGVGSDLDLVLVLIESDRPFTDRPLEWDVTALPVPTDMLVYTAAEWRAMQSERSGFGRALRAETVWVHGQPPQ
jgi:hypothetical protein